jgi:hypothetical protein
MHHRPVAQASSFRRVEAIGRTLPGVEVATAWGQPALKVRGKMFACLASHKSAEPGSLVVLMDITARDALIADDPETYYLKDHYVGHPCVLVRLSRVRADALKDLISGAYRYVSSATRQTPARAARRRTSAPSTRRS